MSITRGTMLTMLVACCLLRASGTMADPPPNGSGRFGDFDWAKTSDGTLYRIACAYYIYENLPTPGTQEFADWPVKTEEGTPVQYWVIAAPATDSVKTCVLGSGIWIDHDDVTSAMKGDMTRWYEQNNYPGKGLSNPSPGADPKYNCVAYAVDLTDYWINPILIWPIDNWDPPTPSVADRAAFGIYDDDEEEWSPCNHLSKIVYIPGSGCDPPIWLFQGKHGAYGVYQTNASVTHDIYGPDVTYYKD